MPLTYHLSPSQTYFLSEAMSDRPCVIFSVFYHTLFIFLGGGAPAAYGGSQARGQFGATAASLRHSHSNTRSKLRLRPPPQLMAMPDP